MFYVVSKLAWLLLAPSNLICLLILLGVVLTFTRLARWGRGIAALGVVLLAVLGFGPVANILILPLEQRFPLPAEGVAAPDGIIVLGGSFDTSVTKARGQVALNEAGDRLTAFAGLAREYPQARLVFTGGSGDLILASANEAETARRLLATLGLASGRLELEDRSRNTWQNAAYTADLVHPQPGQVWWLVTSAYHMPRAMGAFREAGFDVRAYPVDYRTRGWQDATRLFGTVSEGLRRLDVATREWIGLTAYWVTGRSSTWFPGRDG